VSGFEPTARPQRAPEGFPNNHFTLPAPRLLQRFGRALRQMESAI